MEPLLILSVLLLICFISVSSALCIALLGGRLLKSLTLCAMCSFMLVLTSCSSLTKLLPCATDILKEDSANSSGSPGTNESTSSGPLKNLQNSPESLSPK